MDGFLNQSWFWVGFFTAIASLGSILIKELITSKSQVKIERIKIYESDILMAHRELHNFISRAYHHLWPPEEPRREFIEIMENMYFIDVKKHMLFYSQEIRGILRKFETQYACLGDQDLIPHIPFDEFYDNELHKSLKFMEEAIEKRTDSIFH
jgi:hypothetical protein